MDFLRRPPRDVGDAEPQRRGPDGGRGRHQGLQGLVLQVLPTVGASLAFAGLQLVLQSGPCKRRIEGLFKRQRLRHQGDEPSPEEVDRFTAKTIVKLINEVHNFLLVPMSVVAMRQPEIRGNKMYGVTKLSKSINVIASGFFVQDLLHTIRSFSSVGPEMLLHAAICCPVYTYSCQARMAHYYSCGFVLWELSTPFVHARELMYQMGMSKTKAYKVNGLAMITVFFLCRNVWGTTFLVDFFMKSGQELRGANPDPRPPGKSLSRATAWTFRGGGLMMACLNAFWFKKMLQGAIKVFVKKGVA